MSSAPGFCWSEYSSIKHVFRLGLMSSLVSQARPIKKTKELYLRDKDRLSTIYLVNARLLLKPESYGVRVGIPDGIRAE